GAIVRSPTRDLSESFHFDRRALLFQLGLDLRGLVLRDSRLHGLRRAIDQVLRFLQAEARDLTDDLDDLDLLATSVLEQPVELGLLFHGRSRCRTAARRSRAANR